MYRLHNTYRDQIGTAVFSAPDLTVSITETEIVLNPDCFRDLRIVARAGNGGGISAGTTFTVTFWEGDPAMGGSLIFALTLAPLLSYTLMRPPRASRRAGGWR